MPLRSCTSLLTVFLSPFPEVTGILSVMFIAVRTIFRFLLHVCSLSISVVLLHVFKLDRHIWNLQQALCTLPRTLGPPAFGTATGTIRGTLPASHVSPVESLLAGLSTYSPFIPSGLPSL